MYNTSDDRFGWIVSLGFFSPELALCRFWCELVTRERREVAVSSTPPPPAPQWSPWADWTMVRPREARAPQLVHAPLQVCFPTPALPTRSVPEPLPRAWPKSLHQPPHNGTLRWLDVPGLQILDQLYLVTCTGDFFSVPAPTSLFLQTLSSQPLPQAGKVSSLSPCPLRSWWLGSPDGTLTDTHGVKLSAP